MAHRVDTAMRTVQAARSSPVKDVVLIETGASKLGDGHHPVLPIGNFCDYDIGTGAIVRHIPTKATGPANSPPRPGLTETAGGSPRLRVPRPRR